MLFLPQSLTPTLVRPQTFDPLQSPDSDSPSVRFQQKLLSTCCLDILPSQAFLARTLYIQFSRCIVPTAWFSLFSTRLLSHTLHPLLRKVEDAIFTETSKIKAVRLTKIFYLNCKQESRYTLPCFPPASIAGGLRSPAGRKMISVKLLSLVVFFVTAYFDCIISLFISFIKT